MPGFRSKTFGLRRTPTCSQMMSPESAEKFSYHLTQEMVTGRASTGLFICVWTPPPHPNPTSLFLHLQLDWWSIFLLLHVAPNLAKVTGGWLGQFPSGDLALLLTSWNRAAAWRHNPNEKAFCSLLSSSSCLQELILAALKEALFT